jgi:hypothetical protein
MYQSLGRPHIGINRDWIVWSNYEFAFSLVREKNFERGFFKKEDFVLVRIHVPDVSKTKILKYITSIFQFSSSSS